MDNNITLHVDKQLFGGWKSARIERGIDRGAGGFSLSVSERFPGESKRWKINPGAKCVLKLNDKTVITGYVDSVERSLSAQSHDVSISGRDITADMVDCSASVGDNTGHLLNQSLLDVAVTLAKPFGVAIINRAGKSATERFEQVSIEPGETCWSVIERLARQRALMLVSNGAGGLEISRAGTTRMKTALVEGKNILEASLSLDDTGRFHTYIGLGQSAASNSWDDAEAATQIKSKPVIDQAIRKARKHILAVEDAADGISIEERMEWERNVRRGKARNVSVTVNGFVTPKGESWVPNHLVQVDIPTLDISAALLLVSVTQTLDNNGFRTSMTLAPRSAYDLLPETKGNKSEGPPMIDWGIKS